TGGGATSKMGVLPLPNEENWFLVTFNGARNNSYHPQITISSVDDIRFDLFSGASCSAPTLSCPNESNNPSTNIKNWEEIANQGGNEGGIHCGSSTLACNSPCDCGRPAYNGMPVVGSNGSIYIKVHRVTGSPTCHTYTLSVTD